MSGVWTRIELSETKLFLFSVMQANGISLTRMLDLLLDLIKKTLTIFVVSA